MANPLGISDEAWTKLQNGAREVQSSIAANGTVNGKTGNQNLAAVIQQPGNTTKTTATPYISANGTTDYHISGQPDTGYAPPQQNISTPQTNTPVASTPTPQPMSAGQAQQAAPDYAALAAARTAAALANKRTIAQQQKASADTAYNQQNLRTKDDRTLGDFSRTQVSNPFANMGRKSFQEGLIGRERTQADADASAALQTQKANIDQLLADYENATYDEQIRIADELQRADRAYKLDVDKFNQGQSNWDKEFGQNQQQIDYSQNPNNPNNVGQVLQNQGSALQNQLAQYQLDNYPTEMKQKAQLFEQELKSGKMSNEAAEYNLKQLKDPNSATNKAQALDLQMKQLEAKNLPEKQRFELQQLKKQIAEIGVVHYKPQTDAEVAQDKVTLATATKQLEDIGKGIYPGDKPPAAIPYKTNPEFAKDVAHLKASPADAAKLDTNPEPFITAYGYDGYLALRKEAGLED